MVSEREMAIFKGQRDPLWDQCVEYSSETEKISTDLMFLLDLNETID